VLVQGSGKSPYRVEAVDPPRADADITCTCGAFINKSDAGGGGGPYRSCKHIRGVVGTDYEAARQAKGAERAAEGGDRGE